MKIPKENYRKQHMYISMSIGMCLGIAIEEAKNSNALQEENKNNSGNNRKGD